MLPTSRLALAVLVTLASSACGSAPPPQPEPIGLAGLPAEISVSEWPYWVDIPIETKDYDRAWKTVIDIVSEKAAIGVLDKESGYVRTEWRPVDISSAMLLFVPGQSGEGRRATIVVTPNMTGEERYTFRIRTADSKIRMGIEARVMPSQRWANGLRNQPNAPWVSIHRELQDRLAVAR